MKFENPETLKKMVDLLNNSMVVNLVATVIEIDKEFPKNKKLTAQQYYIVVNKLHQGSSGLLNFEQAQKIIDQTYSLEQFQAN